MHGSGIRRRAVAGATAAGGAEVPGELPGADASLAVPLVLAATAARKRRADSECVEYLAGGDLGRGHLIAVVEGVIGTLIEGEHGAVERDTRKQSARA